MPQFSILLPTRNRLNRLKHAIHTVLGQNCQDWEIIISDNDSEQDIRGYVSQLKDPRISYCRTPRLCSSSENWNYALDRSAGAYVVMLGDEHGLMKDALDKLAQLIKEFNKPEFIYANAVQFVHPGVLPGEPNGFINRGYAFFFEQPNAKARILDQASAAKVVRDSMDFKLACAFNVQHSIVSRRMIGELKANGPFFESPFPDFYVTVSLFLKSERIVIEPKPLLLIGVSCKGNDFPSDYVSEPLRTRLKPLIFPGTQINTSWLAAMEAVKLRNPDRADLEVNFERYRMLQILALVEKLGDRALDTVKPFLTKREQFELKVFYNFSLRLMERSGERTRKELKQRFDLIWSPYPVYDDQKRIVDFDNLAEGFELLHPDDQRLAMPLELKPLPKSLRALLARAATEWIKDST